MLNAVSKCGSKLTHTSISHSYSRGRHSKTNRTYSRRARSCNHPGNVLDFDLAKPNLSYLRRQRTYRNAYVADGTVLLRPGNRAYSYATFKNIRYGARYLATNAQVSSSMFLSRIPDTETDYSVNSQRTNTNSRQSSTVNSLDSQSQDAANSPNTDPNAKAKMKPRMSKAKSLTRARSSTSSTTPNFHPAPSRANSKTLKKHNHSSYSPSTHSYAEHGMYKEHNIDEDNDTEDGIFTQSLPTNLRRNMYSPVDIITKKRCGETLTPQELHWFISGFHEGYVKDYQMSAFLMAVCLKGISNREAANMTLAMVNTGKTADLSNIRPNSPKVDKHSTGGVGDKLSLILTPLAASLGLCVPMICSKSLGFSGGTIDKLTSIPGLNANLSSAEYKRILEEIGCVISEPSDDYAPVERHIFELRDVTGTVENVGLVASSIMAKKLAEKPDAVLLDVKLGKGSFFKSLNDVAALATTMVAIGEEAGIKTRCMVSNMDQPLGNCVGNWLETREAIQVLGENNADFKAHNLDIPFRSKRESINELKELALYQCALMLELGGLTKTFAEGYELSKAKLESGECLVKFADLVQQLGGDRRYCFDLSLFPLSTKESGFQKTYFAEKDGVVLQVDAHEIGVASVKLGVGRTYITPSTVRDVDYSAGLFLHKKSGDKVRKGDPIVTVFVGDSSATDSSGFLNSVSFGLEEPEIRLEHGFEKAKKAYHLVSEYEYPNVYISEHKLVEYFVDTSGLKPFEFIKHNPLR